MEQNFILKYRQCSIEELDTEMRTLVAEAEAATQGSFSPYSNFKVGAAARLSNGKILRAANVESEVFPAGICAERALLFYVSSNFPDETVEAIAIFAPASKGVCTPCGSCRQSLYDVENRQQKAMQVIMTGSGRALIVDSAKGLLPFTFEL